MPIDEEGMTLNHLTPKKSLFDAINAKVLGDCQSRVGACDDARIVGRRA